ncbi:MAG: hypothetical protein A2W75_02700 [Nitrospinae bacterium RIFCSPLOWO2_12_39_15]|nr:MAG: hypothetical protein A2W75_02700 [Nitrospinae bacterium RIFCSPLOWO2_12_39_15]
MKKLVLVLGLFLGIVSAGYSYSFRDLFNDVGQQTKLTILESATPAYFFSIENRDSKGGVITPFVEYRFLTLDAGFVTPFDAKKVGTGVLGGSIHIDRLIALSFPTFTEYSNLFVPKTAQKFWDKVNIGLFTGHNFDEKKFEYGFYSGLEFRF